MIAPVLWFIGLPGSGKSTLSRATTEYLVAHPEILPSVRRWELLDGDQIREFLGDEVGYAPRDRRISVRVMGLLARQLAQSGAGVVVANISPFRDLRRFMREHIPGYHEIYCRCSVEDCIARDAKGAYRRQLEAGPKDFVGLDIAFEEPEHPDLVLDTASRPVEECLADVRAYLHRLAK